MYVDEKFYMEQYEALPSGFSRLRRKAERMMDNATTGIDGVKKLRSFFPVDPDDLESVKMCDCELIRTLSQIEEYEASAKFVVTPNGVHGGVISSMSAGNESISFSTNATTFEKALANPAARADMFREMIENNLRGIADANGVNLLFMGPYPR